MMRRDIWRLKEPLKRSGFVKIIDVDQAFTFIMLMNMMGFKMKNSVIEYTETDIDEFFEYKSKNGYLIVEWCCEDGVWDCWNHVGHNDVHEWSHLFDVEEKWKGLVASRRLGL